MKTACDYVHLNPVRAKLLAAEDRLVAYPWSSFSLCLATQQKSHPLKLALAARLRRETTLSVKQIAEGLHLGKAKGARTNLHKFMNPSQPGSPQIRLGI